MPCPNGVDIPRIFEFYNEAIIFSDAARRRRMYSDPNMIKDEERADKCIKCEQCVEKCPQKLADTGTTGESTRLPDGKRLN